jgi:putative phosphoribosyl transferase
MDASQSLEEGRQAMAATSVARADQHLIQISTGPIVLDGNLDIPEGASGVVLFAHGSGSSRHSPRNNFVAQALQEAGLATLLIDLLTPKEDAIDVMTAHLRFDIGLLARRLLAAVDWLVCNSLTKDLSIGCFGASTGAAAALVAAAERPERVAAVFSRGGRPDLAGPDLPRVKAPTLLVVGGNDTAVIDLNRDALAELGSEEKRLVLVPGATHLFEEPGTLEEVARLAANWFHEHLP